MGVLNPWEVKKVQEILDDPSVFAAFEEHLRRECSEENLNFLVEVIMYRRLCKKHRRKKRRRLRKAQALLGENFETIRREAKLYSNKRRSQRFDSLGSQPP